MSLTMEFPHQLLGQYKEVKPMFEKMPESISYNIVLFHLTN